MISSDSITFLAKNHFDFTKLFKEGISYLQAEKAASYLKKSEEELKDIFYRKRFAESLSTPHQEKLEDYMNQIVGFLCDELSDRKLTFEIPSYTLKKRLSQEIKIRYNGKSVFSNFLRGCTKFEVEKGRDFPQG